MKAIDRIDYKEKNILYRKQGRKYVQVNDPCFSDERSSSGAAGAQPDADPMKNSTAPAVVQQRLVRSHWAIPRNVCWLVFDLSNGDPLSRRYVWWFETRQAARDHIARQKKQKHSADLSPPMKFIPANDQVELKRP